MLRRTKNSRLRSLRVEQLDNRLLLAGDCAVALDSGGDLSIVCDNADNQINVSENFLTGELIVAGQLGTGINGEVDGELNLGVVDLDDVTIRTRGGNDTVLINSVNADDVLIALGKGDDTVVAGFNEVSDDFVVRGGKGNDNIGLLAITAGDRIRVNGGQGDDFVDLTLVEATRLRMQGGVGNDTLNVNSAVGNLVASGFEIETGGEDDDDGPTLPPIFL